jgi:uncharacterized protein DUF234
VQAIARQVGQDPRALSYYLQQLQELGYVERRYPLTGEPPSARSVHYDLPDPLLRFWFRFIFPSTSYIRHMGPDRALKDLIRPHLEPYFGLCFERLCREALPWLYLKEGVAAAFEVGQYWSKTTQIDVVGLRDDGWTDLGECKWGAARSPKAVESPEGQDRPALRCMAGARCRHLFSFSTAAGTGAAGTSEPLVFGTRADHRPPGTAGVSPAHPLRR